MYDPNQCSNSYCEWIELYNPSDEQVNLTNWKLCDDNLLSGYINNTDTQNYLDNGTLLNPKQYAIITDGGSGTLVYDNFDVSETALALHIEKSSLCGGLSNSKESILLINDEILIDNVTYEDSWGANGDGKSLQFFNNSWCANTPTPGQENYCPSQPSFIFSYPSHVLSDGTIFLVNVEFSGFSDGMYDVKIDVMDGNESRIGRIYDTNDKEWQSTTYYIYNASTVENGSGSYLAYLKIDPDKNYTGIATAQARLRLSETYAESDLYTFSVVDTILSEKTEEESQELNSSLRILDISPSPAKFGDVVKVKIDSYRGDTAKYAVYAYIESDSEKKVSEETTMHFKNKFTNYSLIAPLQLKPNCNGKYDDGDYRVIVEGLDERDSMSIKIEGITKSLCEETTIEKTTSTKGSFTYAIVDAPQEVASGEEFTIQLNFQNDDDEKHKAEVWSYVYSGNKCYCKDREENKEEVSLAPEKSEIITLKNKVIDAEPGNYKLKVYIIKDNQKTKRELTREIKVIPSSAGLYTRPFQNQQPEEISLESEKYPQVIYESTNIKAQKLIPIFIIILLAILSAILIWKR